jgi:formaldehyde-activating enzyme involved in methanogenesis
MKKFLIAIVFAFVSQLGFAQDKPSKVEVLQVIEKSGGSGQLNAAKKQILGMIPADKQAAFVVEFDVLVKKANDATAEIYMNEYTKEDVKAMLAFYNSPTGKKMADKSEVIAEKSQAAMMSLQGEMQTMMSKYMQ